MLGFVRQKRGTQAPGSAFDLKRDISVAGESAGSESSPNFSPRARSRKRKPILRRASQGFLALLANFRKERSARCLQSLRGFRVNFPPLPAARTSKQSMARATTVREMDAPLTIAD